MWLRMLYNFRGIYEHKLKPSFTIELIAEIDIPLPLR